MTTATASDAPCFILVEHEGSDAPPPQRQMDTKALRRELLEAVAMLKALGSEQDAQLLHGDVLRAGHDLGELLMVRDDAERLLGVVMMLLCKVIANLRQAAINAKPGHTIAVALRAAAIELRKAYVNDLDFHSADQWLDALAAELEGSR